MGKPENKITPLLTQITEQRNKIQIITQHES